MPLSVSGAQGPFMASGRGYSAFVTDAEPAGPGPRRKIAVVRRVPSGRMQAREPRASQLRYSVALANSAVNRHQSLGAELAHCCGKGFGFSLAEADGAFAAVEGFEGPGGGQVGSSGCLPGPPGVSATAFRSRPQQKLSGVKT